MQHTKKYRFDLIEKEDVFSPDALNENMEKVEGALKAETAARSAADAAEARARADADAALAQRVSVLELHKCVVGYHAGTGFVDLGFTPIAVFAIGSNGNGFVIAGHGLNGLNIKEGGFDHVGYFTSCRYVAFA